MTSTLKNTATLYLLTFVLLTTSGCVPLLVGAAAGAGGISYARGTLERNFDSSVKSVFKATNKALKGLGASVTEDVLLRHSGKIVATFEDGKNVTVEIKALTERACTLKIRIGIFGDKSRSDMIMGAIIQKL